MTVIGVIGRLRAMDPLLLLLRASLVVLLVNSNDDPAVMAVVAVVCVAALPRPGVLSSPWLWAALFLGIGARQFATWHTIDDHIVVTTYWCAAIAVGLGARDPRVTLAVSARLLVGTLFAFAVGWKLMSGQFTDGTFFRYTLLFDDRFEVVSRVIGKTTDAARAADVAAVSQLLSGSGTGQVALQEGSGAVALAQVFTGWALVSEAVIAFSFLLLWHERWAWLRHGSLVAFAATTYLVVPVGGFGALLLLLGAAQATTDRLRLAYVVGIGGLIAWAATWPLLFLP